MQAPTHTCKQARPPRQIHSPTRPLVSPKTPKSSLRPVSSIPSPLSSSNPARGQESQESHSTMPQCTHGTLPSSMSVGQPIGRSQVYQSSPSASQCPRCPPGCLSSLLPAIPLAIAPCVPVPSPPPSALAIAQGVRVPSLDLTFPSRMSRASQTPPPSSERPCNRLGCPPVRGQESHPSMLQRTPWDPSLLRTCWPAHWSFPGPAQHEWALYGSK